MRRLVGAVVAVGAVVGAAVVTAQGPAAPPQAPAAVWQPPDDKGEGQMPIMPVYQEPHHRQVFQYGPMRILDLQIPPGDTSWFHSHEWPVFYVTVGDSTTRTQLLGQEWGAGRARGAGAAGGGAAGGGAPGAAPRGTGPGAAGPGAAGAGGTAPAGAPSAATAPAPGTSPNAPPAGAAAAAGGPGAPGAARAGGPGPFRGRPRLMSEATYIERPVTHRIGNTGNGLFRAIVVVNETMGGDEAVTEQAAGFNAKPDFANRWFRAYRITLAPGEKSAAHRHTAPVVLVQNNAGKGTAAGAMKFEFNELGQWAFFDAGDRHELTNAGSTPLELVEIEVRRK